MINQKISELFMDIARLLEIKGENIFRIRAYERAAENIIELNEDLEKYIQEDRLKEIAGIGEDLARKIKEYAATGKVRQFEEMKRTIPVSLLELLNIPSLGPKTVKLLYERLKIKSIPELERAIKKDKLAGLSGVRDKTIQNILKGIDIIKKGKERLTLIDAIKLSKEFISYLESTGLAKKVVAAGSLRRHKETIRDIDILVVSDSPKKIMDYFTGMALVKDVLAKGSTKSSIRTKENTQVDCRVVEGDSFGAALVYFTGSKNFNIKLRQIAIRKGLKINEYGVYRGRNFIAGKTEEEVFKILGMPYIEPELREDTGEIELALKQKLPKLIDISDVKGDLHVHSVWSDGKSSIIDIVQKARERGYSYIAITDHSQSLRVANGLKVKDLMKKKEEILKINKGLKDFRVLYGTEVDIASDGSIDYKDGILKEFDVVVGAIHSGFKESKRQLTNRIMMACKNKYVHVIAHPTGRLMGVRDAYEIDMDEILKVAKDTNTHLEINAFPQRSDLNDHYCRKAKEAGVKLAIGTDSHDKDHLGYMELGVFIARRGWLAKEDVINSFDCQSLLKRLNK